VVVAAHTGEAADPAGTGATVDRPEAVARWSGTHQGAKVVSEWNPFDMRHEYEDE
jgi:hypothetical protein